MTSDSRVDTTPGIRAFFERLLALRVSEILDDLADGRTEDACIPADLARTMTDALDPLIGELPGDAHVARFLLADTAADSSDERETFEHYRARIYDDLAALADEGGQFAPPAGNLHAWASVHQRALRDLAHPRNFFA